MAHVTLNRRRPLSLVVTHAWVRVSAGLLVLSACSCASPPPRPWRTVPAEVRTQYDALYDQFLAAERLPARSAERAAAFKALLEPLEAVAEQAPEFFRLRRTLQDVRVSVDATGARREYAVDDQEVDPARLTLAARLLIDEDETHAHSLLRRALEEDEDFSWATYGLAHEAARAEDWGDAETLLEPLVRDDPDFPEAHRLLAVARETMGDRVGALESYEAYLALVPADTVARQRSAHLRLASDDADETRRAERDLRRVLARLPEGDPAILQARIDLGVALALQGQPRRALEEFDRVLLLDPGSLPALYNVGWIHEEQLGNDAEALSAYRRYLALAEDPERPLDVQEVFDSLFHVRAAIRRLEAATGGGDDA